MATITSVATAAPGYLLRQEEIKAALLRVFSQRSARTGAIKSVFENARVERRYSVLPLEELSKPRSLTESTHIYCEHATALAHKVARDCLDQAGARATDVDFLITTSCTGIMMPSLDAHLINGLGFRHSVRRLPITELGCAGGACALSRAHEFVRAFPGSSALVVAVELPTLTFQHSDVSPANIVSSAIFGDGAAAALLTGDATAGIRILDTGSHLFPNSIDVLGFDLEDSGLHIVLSSHLPKLIRGQMRPLVEALIAPRGLALGDLSFWVLHPGGSSVLSALEEEFGLERRATQPSWDVLRDYGNLSSASVLFVLHEWMARRPRPRAATGLMVAFGPGFSSEMLLLQWN